MLCLTFINVTVAQDVHLFLFSFLLYSYFSIYFLLSRTILHKYGTCVQKWKFISLYSCSGYDGAPVCLFSHASSQLKLFLSQLDSELYEQIGFLNTT